MKQVIFSMIVVFSFLLGCKAGALPEGIDLDEIYLDKDVVKLVRAAGKGNTKEIDKLVAKGVDINKAGKDGFTPLLGVLLKQNKKGVNRLLKHGANPNLAMVGDLEGDSPIWFAAKMSDTYFLKEMLINGGDPDYQNNRIIGQKLLHAAILGNRENKLERIHLLVESGANINARDANGKTPLLQAATINEYRIMYELLKMGADYSIKSNQGLNVKALVETGSMYPKIKNGAYWRNEVMKTLNLEKRANQ